jgi:hypothetical protein
MGDTWGVHNNMTCPDWKNVKHTPIFILGPSYPGTNTKISICRACKDCTFLTPKDIISLVDDINTAKYKELPDLPIRGRRPKAKPFCRKNKQFVFQKARTGECENW